MRRKTAIAAAIAITMSLTSGVVALGAHTGALGFGGAASVAVTPRAAAPTGDRVGLTGSQAKHEHDDTARSIKVGADSAASTKGEHHD